MQDKPALQQRLARDLASLLTLLKPDVVVPFMEAFWQTMSREWRNIEALRMDKYLYLVRQYVNAGFGWAGMNSERVDALAEVLEEGPLHAKDVKVPDGLRYHILDVYVDELEKVEGEQLQGKQEILEKLLEPVIKLGKEGRHKALRKAAREVLDDERVKTWRGEEEKETKEEGESSTTRKPVSRYGKECVDDHSSSDCCCS